MQFVGEVSDGLEAVQQAQQLQPDLILLDIGLPTLNGIEAARQIRQVSPKSKILCISENRSPDIVEEALGTGARGYVVKWDAGSELLPAVKAVLQGKPFVSASLACRDSINPQNEHAAEQAWPERVVAPSQPQSAKGNRHELRLYSDDPAFLDDFAHSVEAALDNGHAVVIIATESHRANLLQHLKADGVDVDCAAGRKLYISLDVSDSASRVMDGRDGADKRVPQAIAEALQTAKDRQLHLTVG